MENREVVEVWEGDSPRHGRITVSLYRWSGGAHYDVTHGDGTMGEVKTIGLGDIDAARRFAIEMGYACRDVPVWTRVGDGEWVAPVRSGMRRWNGLASGRPCPARVNLTRHPPPWDFAVSQRNTWVLVDAVGVLITDDVGSDATVGLMRRYNRAVARADARSATVTRNG